MKKILIYIIIVVCISYGCDLMKSEEYNASATDRWDKTVNALTYIRTARALDFLNYPEVNKANYFDPNIFATFDSLLIMTGLENMLKAEGSHTFFIPTNRAFYEWYKSSLNYQNGKRVYYKLAQLPDSTKRNIVLTSIVPNVKILNDDLTPIDTNYKTARGCNITLRRPTDRMAVRCYPWPVGTTTGITSYEARTRNLEPTNGAIHVMDNIIMPKESTMHLGSAYVPAN